MSDKNKNNIYEIHGYWYLWYRVSRLFSQPPQLKQIKGLLPLEGSPSQEIQLTDTKSLKVNDEPILNCLANNSKT